MILIKAYIYLNYMLQAYISIWIFCTEKAKVKSRKCINFLNISLQN